MQDWPHCVAFLGSTVYSSWSVERVNYVEWWVVKKKMIRSFSYHTFHCCECVHPTILKEQGIMWYAANVWSLEHNVKSVILIWFLLSNSQYLLTVFPVHTFLAFRWFTMNWTALNSEGRDPLDDGSVVPTFILQHRAFWVWMQFMFSSFLPQFTTCILGKLQTPNCSQTWTILFSVLKKHGSPPQIVSCSV